MEEIELAILSISGQFLFLASRGPHKAFTSILVESYSCTKKKPHISELSLKQKLLNNLYEQH